MISVNVGPNEQFTVLQSDFLGTAKLDPEAKVTVFSSFFFQSAPDKTFDLRKEFSGPQYANGAEFVVPGDEIRGDIWSQCGQSDVAIVSNRLALVGQGAGEATGEIDPGQNIQLATRSC